MPTYTYRCTHCSHILEAFQSMSEDPLKDCSNCSKATLERVLLSAPSFALKGGGWYKTDYASNKAPSAPEKATDTQKASSGETQ